MRSVFTWISSFFTGNCSVDTLQEQQITFLVTFVGINLVEAGVIEFVSSKMPASHSVQFVIMLGQGCA